MDWWPMEGTVGGMVEGRAGWVEVAMEAAAEEVEVMVVGVMVEGVMGEVATVGSEPPAGSRTCPQPHHRANRTSAECPKRAARL